MSYYDYASCEGILQMADAEAGPGCCDDEYVRLRSIMAASEDLLEALEVIMDLVDASGSTPHPSVAKVIGDARAAIAKARDAS